VKAIDVEPVGASVAADCTLVLLGPHTLQLGKGASKQPYREFWL
jgi:hypothetical protein